MKFPILCYRPEARGTAGLQNKKAEPSHEGTLSTCLVGKYTHVNNGF